MHEKDCKQAKIVIPLMENIVFKPTSINITEGIMLLKSKPQRRLSNSRVMIEICILQILNKFVILIFGRYANISKSKENRRIETTRNLLHQKCHGLNKILIQGQNKRRRRKFRPHWNAKWCSKKSN